MTVFLQKWIITIILVGIGAFNLFMTYGALIASKKRGKYISGVPCVGGVFIAVGFLFSPIKWLAFLGLLDYGIWYLPYTILKDSQKNSKDTENSEEESKEE